MSNPCGRVFLVLARAFGACALVVLLAPFACAVWMSFAPGEVLEPPTGEWSLRWYLEFFRTAKWTRALRTSAEVAGLSVAGSLIGGLGLATAVARFHFRGRQVLAGAVLLPMFVPAVVLAMGLLPLAMRAGVQGRPWALAAAHSLVSLPVVFLILRSALGHVDPDLERAARGLGAGPWTAFRRVTAPLISPAVSAGAVIACILSVNEFAFAVFLGTPRGRTLPAALWPEARDKHTPLLAAASCLTVLFTLAAMWVAGRLLRRVSVSV
jgi:ABC-type spermidine/putrescine transport system permease subunit II